MTIDPDYWKRQTSEKPLFPDMLWSRPENRMQAGKLLIVGGNVHGFVAPADAFRASTSAGIGSVRMLLPDSLKKLLGNSFDMGEYAPTTPSGSFSKLALEQALSLTEWADGVLIAGDLGRNSETAIMLEKLMDKYDGQLTITKDAADYCLNISDVLVKRPDTMLVISLAQLQKLGTSLKYRTAFTFDMDILRFVSALHDFTGQFGTNIIVRHLDQIFVAVGGRISSTPIQPDTPVWRVTAAARAATWWIQNPEKQFEALTTSLVTTETK